jgi:hypothetical protein
VIKPFPEGRAALGQTEFRGGGALDAQGSGVVRRVMAAAWQRWLCARQAAGVVWRAAGEEVEGFFGADAPFDRFW